MALRVLQASLGQLVLMETLVLRVNQDPRVLLELLALVDRLGKLVTKVHKVHLGQWVMLEIQVFKA